MFNDDILNSIKDIINTHRVFLVGGYLRNYFLKNEISSDRDLVCLDSALALAKEISDFLSATLIELDSENQIYRVVLKDKKNYFDISQAFDSDILKDAKRRDFTINSVFYDLNKEEIFDPMDGIKDIKNKIIRCVDFNNLIDDPLRFLRLYRFLANTDFEIEKELLEFSKINFSKINTVAKERINQEIIHLFEGEFVCNALEKMFDNGALELIFPFVSKIKVIPPNTHHHLDLIHHSIETVRQIRINNPLLKIAAFYHDIGKPACWTIEPKGRHRFIGHDLKGAKIAVNELKELKFSKKQIKYITDMIKYHIYPASLINCADNKKAYARFVRKLGDNVVDIIELSRADRLSAQGVAVTKEMVDSALNHLENLLNYYNEMKEVLNAPKPILDGNEIIEILNIKPSKQVGLILESLKEAQLMKTVTTKQEAIDFIKNKKF